MSKAQATDWTAAARAFGRDIPDEQVAKIAPILEALERSMRPVLTGLPLDLAPSTDVEPGE